MKTSERVIKLESILRIYESLNIDFGYQVEIKELKAQINHLKTS